MTDTAESATHQGPQAVTVDGITVHMAYPDLLLAPLESVEHLSLGNFSQEVVATFNMPERAPGAGLANIFPVVSLIVTTEPQVRFHPDFSIREPVEIQFWSDRRITMEIEFVGVDVREMESTWQVMDGVLRSWASAHGLPFLGLHNNRGRSLPDVWNASFSLDRKDRTVGEAIEMAQRAIRVAEFRRYSAVSLQELGEALSMGDAHALFGLDRNSLVQMRAALPSTDAERTATASDVCAFANSPHGGLIVYGMIRGDGPAGQMVIQPATITDQAAALQTFVRKVVYPTPDRMTLDTVPIDGFNENERLLVLAVPAQDKLLQPFLLHGTLDDADNTSQFVSIVERQGTDTHVMPIGSLHAVIQAGRAFLLGQTNATNDNDRQE